MSGLRTTVVAASVVAAVALSACSADPGPQLTREEAAGFNPVGVDWQWSQADRTFASAATVWTDRGSVWAEASFAPEECETIALLPSLVTTQDAQAATDEIVFLPAPAALPADQAATADTNDFGPPTDPALAYAGEDRPVQLSVRLFADGDARGWLDELEAQLEGCEGGFIVTGGVPWSIRQVVLGRDEVGGYPMLTVRMRGYADGAGGFEQYDATEFTMVLVAVGNTVMGAGFAYDDFVTATTAGERVLARQYVDYAALFATS